MLKLFLKQTVAFELNTGKMTNLPVVQAASKLFRT